jgi:hypothetical protein
MLPAPSLGSLLCSAYGLVNLNLFILLMPCSVRPLAVSHIKDSAIFCLLLSPTLRALLICLLQSPTLKVLYYMFCLQQTPTLVALSGLRGNSHLHWGPCCVSFSATVTVFTLFFLALIYRQLYHTIHNTVCHPYHTNHTMPTIPYQPYHANHIIPTIPCQPYHTNHTMPTFSFPASYV